MTPSQHTERTERLSLAEAVDLLEVGQPLPFHVHDTQDRRLLAEGHVLVSRTQLEMLIARGAWVQRSVALAVRAERQVRQQRDSLVPSSRRSLSLFDQWEQLVWKLDATLRLVLAGRPARDELVLLAERFEALVERDTDVALFMMVRQYDVRFALYALQHALHSATVLELLGRQLGWDTTRRRLQVLAALTMNVSTLELQAQMAQQADPPTTRQRKAIAEHPEQSVRLLRAAGVTDATWLQTVLEHHERPDGSGYPKRLTQIVDSAHALQLADVFTAKISARAIRSAMPIQLAAKQLFQEERGSALAVGLVKALGLYPPGELVTLRSGEIAVVTHRSAAPTKPRVAAITNSAGQPITATTVRDTAQPEFAVVGVVEDRRHLPRIPPERVYGAAYCRD
jgi:HD-GYP domain-containing protein (c-di-GMP phosphodiesterase class II)